MSFKMFTDPPPTKPFTYDELVELCGCPGVEMTIIETLESGMRYCDFLESEAERHIEDCDYFQAIALLRKILGISMCVDTECLKLNVVNSQKLKDLIFEQNRVGNTIAQSADSL